ncbi:nuclear transport factor 2 family protein [Pelotalea chapellei]|uniref:Nuclear transport factor 2 family protein n=1 Tax=Pelotalea chapellei TaxID=44671 RepID=A0ABS5U498_9BACT|nr:nuclear transport factor 2 family protein [Pelotalea chapellei]MBT1070504.1 nuclear transport factor 2 family protein [Pelotalea chapellei]
MSDNKNTIERYLDGFRKGDHEKILSCLTEDVIWDLPGAFHLVGKQEFDKEIENPAFQGHPDITVSRTTEENDVVIVEGTVQAQKASGGVLDLAFVDVFEMRNAKICRLISYLMEVKADGV